MSNTMLEITSFPNTTLTIKVCEVEAHIWQGFYGLGFIQRTPLAWAHGGIPKGELLLDEVNAQPGL